MKEVSEMVKSGGLTGQGFNNLLGRPKLNPLSLVLREAVQNSWDARLRTPRSRGTTLRFSIRVRDLESKEDAYFRKWFDQSDGREPVRSNQLARALKATLPVRVLELCDFGTVGLEGVTRPDLPSGGVASRFVNFFFDVGRSHESSGDGGTYGFGRSSLYTAGAASMILVDSLVQVNAKLERRTMGCRIGSSFEVQTGWNKGRYSGRHYWGTEKYDIGQPLTGLAATDVATRLGLPDRRLATELGTTILIPWPVNDFNDGSAVTQTLLRHLWPKMVPGPGQPVTKFEIEIDGRSFKIPNPETLDEYRLYVQALKIARSRNETSGAIPIETQRPRHVTGHLGIVPGVLAPASPEAPVVNADDEEDDSMASISSQVALMRSSELVVRYLPVAGTQSLGSDWAGVFICESGEPVSTAFARSEPPAHDDWNCDRLQERTEKYLVRKTVQNLLPEAVKSALGITRAAMTPGETAGPSLAGASARFSNIFLSGDGQGAAQVGYGASNGGGSGSGLGSNRPSTAKISAPVFAGLEMRGDTRVALFTVAVEGNPGACLTIRSTPWVHAEGRLDSMPDGFAAPTVVGYRGAVGEGATSTLTLSKASESVEIAVAFNSDCGVTLSCELELSSR